MSIQSDKWIKKMALEHQMISPFVEKQISNGKISFGLSSFGYDVRVADEYKIFTNVNSAIVDPKNFNSSNFVERQGSECLIPGNSFVLARTIEYFKIPRGILSLCIGKSTYARCGIVVNITPIEPEFEGHITLEFSNTSPNPAKIYSGEGCAQFLFLRGNEEPEISYKDRKGKYQGQTGVTLAKIK